MSLTNASKILSLLLSLVQLRYVDSERGVRVTHGPLGPFAGANFPCSEQDAHRGAPWARGACLITCKRPSCHRAIALCRRKPECTGVNINVEGTVATLKRETALYASPPAHNPLRPTAAHVPRPPARCSGLTSVALHARGGGTGAGLPPKISSSPKTRRTRVRAEIAPAKNGRVLAENAAKHRGVPAQLPQAQLHAWHCAMLRTLGLCCDGCRVRRRRARCGGPAALHPGRRGCGRLVGCRIARLCTFSL